MTIKEGESNERDRGSEGGREDVRWEDVGWGVERRGQG